MKMLNEIANWKLEAESEDANRYFYHVNDLTALEDGSKCFVIGRKGTGKTAICEYFHNLEQFDVFSTKLSFKDFPFNILYALQDSSFTRPSQYISIWKYLIYNSVLKMMSKNNGIDDAISIKLKEIYPEDPIDQMQRTIARWTSKETGLQLFGLGGNKGSEREFRKIEEIWHELIPSMEDSILRYAGTCHYYIVFDELDEDYRSYWDDKNRDQYTALLTSLFKAVSNIKKSFRTTSVNIKPIIFLRDDIYQILSDPDSNKWEDSKVYLKWNRGSLKSMLAWRIARSRSDSIGSPIFDREISHIFPNSSIKMGTSRTKTVEIFEYISALTHERPRDYVRYLRDCAKSSISQGHQVIQRDTIRGVEKEYSNHLKTEIINEMEGVVPDVRLLFEHIGSLRKERIAASEFRSWMVQYIESARSSAETKGLGVDRLCRVLFHFSVIGNAVARDGNVPKYKYQNEYLVFNPDATVVIHRGLLRSLGIISPWADDRF